MMNLLNLVVAEEGTFPFGDGNNKCEMWWDSHSIGTPIQIRNPLQES